MKKTYLNILKYTIYFLLFALILYWEKYMIDMQVGSSIDDKDRSGGIGITSMLMIVCTVPFFILWDLGVRNTLCRLSALLAQICFSLWSLFWFLDLKSLRYDMQYQGMKTER